MRHLPLALLLCLGAGCQSYTELQESFCVTAKLSGQPVALCDDFEVSTINTTKWAQNTNSGGTLSVELYDQYKHDSEMADPGYAYRGVGVLHAMAPTNAAAQLVDTAVTNPTGAAGLTPTSVRFFLWVGDVAPSTNADLVDIVDGEDKLVRSLSMNQGTLTITDAATGQTANTGAQLETSHWSCVQVDFSANLIDATVDEDLDGEQDVSLGSLPGVPQPSATHIGLLRGDDMISSTTAVWIDEVIIDHSHIPCID